MHGASSISQPEAPLFIQSGMGGASKAGPSSIHTADLPPVSRRAITGLSTVAWKGQRGEPQCHPYTTPLDVTAGSSGPPLLFVPGPSHRGMPTTLQALLIGVGSGVFGCVAVRAGWAR
jgi:hypothetical protein